MDTPTLLRLPHPRLRAPRNRSACLWYLLDLVSRGYRYHTGGVIKDSKKVPAFVDKMHVRFRVLLSPSGQRKRRHARKPTARLVMFRDWDGVWLWWLLVAGAETRVRALAEAYGEVLRDAERTDGRLRFREDYVLRQRQRPRGAGGGRTWTWFMSKRRETAVERELIALAAAHGRGRERTDDLLNAVQRLRQRPMFHGVRAQASHALLRAGKVWRKTHSSDVPVPAEMTAQLPWFAGRIRLFD